MDSKYLIRYEIILKKPKQKSLKYYYIFMTGLSSAYPQTIAVPKIYWPSPGLSANITFL